MEWGVFKDIQQFRVNDTPVADNPPVEEENVADNPPVEDEGLFVVEGTTVVMEENIESEPIEEQPSTSPQRDSPVLRRK